MAARAPPLHLLARQPYHHKPKRIQGRHPASPIYLIQISHRAAASRAQGAAAGAGGAAVGALAHAVGPHRVHRSAGVAPAGGTCRRAAARARRRLAHALQRAGGLWEQGQREEFIIDTMLPLKRQLKIRCFFRRDTGVQCQV